MAPSTSTQATTSVPTFQSLGVRTLINCRGTYTILSGSRALPQVVEAMVAATDHYVHLDELMDKVGQRLAELTGAEWGYVSCGCAAALTEITAACIAGADPEKMARLPDTTGMKNEVIIQKAHRNGYDRAIRLAGAQMVEVVTEADLRAALSERTAMIAITGDQAHLGQIPIAEMIAIGHAHGVPCLVDAAAERPDVPNRYLALGADAVAYSGGKCLRGPQSSGLVLGRKDLLQAAYLNSAPHGSIGRPMKAGKEEIMGLLAAVEAWVLGRDHQAEWRMWEGYLEYIRAAIAEIPSVATRIQQPGVANVAPTLVITWDPQVLRSTPEQVHHELEHGEPPIALHLLPDGLMIMPYMMEAGEDEIVAGRLRQVLLPRTAPEPPQAEASATVADVRGNWLVRIRYLLGQSAHAMTLEQAGSALAGSYRGQYATVPLQGHVQGTQITFRATLGYQSSQTTYAFSGQVQGDTMSGTVTLGGYGQARWTAKKLG